MDALATATLRRVSLTVPDAAAHGFELLLDGWPLLVVDLAAAAVRVNDLRASSKFAHAAPLPSTEARVTVRTGAVGDEVYVLLGEAAAVFLAPDPECATHVDVRVFESATGRLLLDRNVRYRQLPSEPGTSTVRVGIEE